MINTCRHIFYLFLIVCVTQLSCNTAQKPTPPVLFTVLKKDKTGLDFNNRLAPTENFNMFNYMYFYNGSGLGAGDFNNDGLVDLFFASNLGENKLYLNEGKLHFKDATAEAKLPQDNGWSTGVSIVDINNDGLLDIYVCKVGKFEILNGKNQLLICKGINNGVPVYADEASQYGVDFSGFSSQAAFLDYDMDGDLDMYLLNHSVHQNSSFSPRKQFENTYSALSGDLLFRNDGKRFTDVTRESAINSSQIGYGLGIAVSDINMDGWPDIYIGNDFHENDYLYINQKNGTFSDENNQRLMHTSKFSMGVDIADANNDGYPEILSMDMLAADPYILKRSLGDDDYDVFFSKISSGYNYQYSRNNLQYNRRNGVFSEVGMYAGISATDWSWGPLWMDFDNDGLKDLFISNGIPKRLNDMDYINFIYNNEISRKIRDKDIKENDMELINKFPEIKIPNKFYRNKGNLQFEDMENAVNGDEPTYSNGGVYADFDNDGDLDVVVNNVNDAALLYENNTAETKTKHSASINIKGPQKNINGLGTKIFLFSAGQVQCYEKNAVKGFLSSMETPLHISWNASAVDSAYIVWPDNGFERMQIDTASRQMNLKYKEGLPTFDYSMLSGHKPTITLPAVDITSETNLDFRHQENSYNEFDREPLMPHMVSTEGPALAVADINSDGLDDIFIGASKSYHNAIFLQVANGTFRKTDQPEMLKDSMYEDVDATWADVNNDKHIDLVIASGGNEFNEGDEHLSPRIYLNDGKANFTRSTKPFTDQFVTASCIAAADINGDGFVDLFLGGRAMPSNYGETPRSFLLQNDGKGNFVDVAEKNARELVKIGMVTDAVWIDIDRDHDQDLVVCCEWGGVTAFINNGGAFTKKVLSDKKGWWNFVLPADMDNDGDIDIIAGNLGLNNRWEASPAEPVRLYFNDFDDNGKKEQVLTYYLKNKEITFANKDELQRQVPMLKKKYIYAEDFAKAALKDIFPSQKIEQATISSADYFANSLLVNDGKLNFQTNALPWEAQISAYRDAVIADVNGDNLPDIFLAGNYYSNSIHAGRYDADNGTVLINQGKGAFKSENLNGLIIRGEVRHIRPIKIGREPAYILAKNNDSARIVKFQRQTQK